MKKLVLYSDQIPPLSNEIDTELKKLFDKANPRIAFIPSSSDPERSYFQECKSFYYQLGMDLDVYFELDNDWSPDLLESLLDCDAVHLSGGNTYYFLHWLRRRNMMDTLIRYVDRGGVLIGVSAGSILMTPDISTSALCGDDVMEGETDFSGLGLVDFSFVPHFGDIPVTLDDLKQYSRDKQMRVYAARDSGGIVVVENEIKCIGDVIEIDER
ncbi:MAG TPA: type 1 glutamine amidotransferase-like domain-containing protein [Dehalococcoidia bacterium]|nr:type 1 glutamine amidotransferase-like domain-containing protein [Dehalococcoidia bacterium]